MELNQQAKEFLFEAARWATYLSIIGFVGIVFMIILSFAMGTILAGIPNENLLISPRIISIIYLIFAGIYFIPVFYLYQFGSKTKQAITDNDTDLLAFGIKKLKSQYKFIVISTLLIISIYLLMVLSSALLY